MKATNKVIIDKSACADCWSNKSKGFKEKPPRKKLDKTISILNFSYTDHYKKC